MGEMRANVSYVLRLKLPLGCDFGIKWRCNERAGAGGGNGKGIQKNRRPCGRCS